MRISDWSSDVCSSDLSAAVVENEDRAEIGRVAVLERPGDGLAAARGKLHIAEKGGDGVVIMGHAAHLYPGRTSVNIIRVKRSEERRVGKECVSTCRARW